MLQPSRRSIRVLHVIARMNVGGPAVEITDLMRGLDSEDFSQRLVTGFCDDGEEDFLDTQAQDLQASRIRGLGRSVSPMADSSVMMKLGRMIRASQPDIVHTHTAKAGLLGRVAAASSGLHPRIVHTYHGHLLHGYFGPMKTRALVHVERTLARVTDRLVIVGDRVRDELLSAGIGRGEQYSVIRSGVGLSALPQRHAAKRDLGFSEEVVLISMIGRLTQIKRPDRFLDVVEILARDFSNVHFIVAGGGECETDLRTRVETGNLPVTFLGWRSDIPRLVAASDISLLTSDNEGVPLSLVQAAYAGVPSVATDVGSVSEIVIDGTSGFLRSPNAADLAAATARLVEDRELRESLGLNAQLVAKERFSLEGFLRAHGDLYRDVLNAD